MRLLPLIWTAAEGNTPIDILSVNFAYGLDVVSAFVFGLSRGTNFVQDLERRQKWLEEYRKSHPSEYMFWLLEHPNLTKQLRRIGIHIVPKWFTVADKDFDKWGMRMIDAAEESLQAGLVEDRAISGEMPIAYYQLKNAMSKEQKLEACASFIPNPAQRLELASECLDQLGELSRSIALPKSTELTMIECQWQPETHSVSRRNVQAKVSFSLTKFCRCCLLIRPPGDIETPLCAKPPP